DLADCESMALLKDLMAALGCANVDCRQDGAKLDPAQRAGWLFNSTIAGIDRADALLLIGSNPRKEAPVLNAPLRKRSIAGTFPIGVLGERADLTYAYDYLGAGPGTLKDLVDGKNRFSETLKKAQRPMLILGQGALARKDGAAVLAAARRLAESAGAIKDG